MQAQLCFIIITEIRDPLFNKKLGWCRSIQCAMLLLFFHNYFQTSIKSAVWEGVSLHEDHQFNDQDMEWTLWEHSIKWTLEVKIFSSLSLIFLLEIHLSYFRYLWPLMTCVSSSPRKKLCWILHNRSCTGMWW
jgi:hypothetical protein